jgi:hypothetical protein
LKPSKAALKLSSSMSKCIFSKNSLKGPLNTDIYVTFTTKELL